MHTILEYIRLIRAVNCLIASAAIVVGAYLVDFPCVWWEILLTACSAFLVCASGNIVNDVVDIDTDRINRPNRVLVRNALPLPRVKMVAVFAAFLGAVLAIPVNLAVLTAVLTAIGLLVAYNFYLKRVPGVGNLTVAVLSGLTFLTGGLAVDADLAFMIPGPLVASAFAVFFHLVRELVKDIQDLEGDTQVGIRTIPFYLGRSHAMLVTLGLFFVLVLLTYVPVYYRWYDRAYEILTVYVVDLPLLALLIVAWGNPTDRMLSVVSLALKVGMVIGLIALLLAL